MSVLINILIVLATLLFTLWVVGGCILTDQYLEEDIKFKGKKHAAAYFLLCGPAFPVIATIGFIVKGYMKIYRSLIADN